MFAVRPPLLAATALVAVGLACHRESNTITGQQPLRRSADTPTVVPRLPIVRVTRVDLRRTPTPTPSAAVPTATAVATLVPTGTPVPPTATPTALPAIAISLRGIPWQWDFVAPAGVAVSTTSPYPGRNTITLRAGQSYELHIYDDAFQEDRPHYFSGVPAIGLPGAPVSRGRPETILDFTPADPGDYPFLCTNVCGLTTQHDRMHGFIRVVP